MRNDNDLDDMDATPTLLSDGGGTQFSARSEGRSERCLSAIEQRKKPGKTYYTRLGMLLAMKPTTRIEPPASTADRHVLRVHVAEIHLRSNT